MRTHGYSFLPDAVEQTSHLVFRLSSEEMAERNKWIHESFTEGMSIEEIAKEVGLSSQRVYQILNPSPRKQKKVKGFISRKPKTPREAALLDFEQNRMHLHCKKKDRFGLTDVCHHCFGMMSIIESEYDSNGWPYDWAMLGQEEFIAACQ